METEVSASAARNSSFGVSDESAMPDFARKVFSGATFVVDEYMGEHK